MVQFKIVSPTVTFQKSASGRFRALQTMTTGRLHPLRVALGLMAAAAVAAVPPPSSCDVLVGVLQSKSGAPPESADNISFCQVGWVARS